MDNPLINELYELRKDNYKDLRCFHTDKAMDKRLETIKQLIAKIPPRDRVPTNMKYKKLTLESRLLRWKKCVYVTKDPCMTLVKMQLQLSDKHSWEKGVKYSKEETESLKKQQILPLLHLELIKKTDDELRDMIAG